MGIKLQHCCPKNLRRDPGETRTHDLGGDADHYTTPPGLKHTTFKTPKLKAIKLSSAVSNSKCNLQQKNKIKNNLSQRNVGGRKTYLVRNFFGIFLSRLVSFRFLQSELQYFDHQLRRIL
jgi:hypothetical protein